MDIDRALSKLKFDESVIGYTLITNDGQLFLSFSIPESVIPQIKGVLKIHSTSLKMMNVMSEHGVVVLGRINPDWILAVLFAESSLGIALQKTSDVIRLLMQVDLPPPPTEAVEPPSEAQTKEVTTEPTGSPIADEIIPLETIRVQHGCVVLRGPRFSDAIIMGSQLNRELRKYALVGMDVLLMVDEERTVYKIADALDRPVDDIINAVRWCVSRRIVDVECPEEQETGPHKIIEVPLFDGDLGKVKKQHRPILELCDGTRTLNEVADILGITYFEALQATLPYKGKSLKFIKTDKITEK
ncbi:MAG: hypothetical protein ACTSYL_01155 [Candidatus Thorarchaeota archaeon]